MAFRCERRLLLAVGIGRVVVFAESILPVEKVRRDERDLVVRPAQRRLDVGREDGLTALAVRKGPRAYVGDSDAERGPRFLAVDRPRKVGEERGVRAKYRVGHVGD